MLNGIEVWQIRWPIHDLVFDIHKPPKNFLQFVDRRIVFLVMWSCRGNCQANDVSEVILHLRTRGVSTSMRKAGRCDLLKVMKMRVDRDWFVAIPCGMLNSWRWRGIRSETQKVYFTITVRVLLVVPPSPPHRPTAQVPATTQCPGVQPLDGRSTLTQQCFLIEHEMSEAVRSSGYMEQTMKVGATPVGSCAERKRISSEPSERGCTKAV